MNRPLDAGISRILNAAAAKRMAEARRLTQKTVIEQNRLLFTGIASELPRFGEDVGARILFQDIDPAAPNYNPNASYEVFKP